MRCEDYDDPTSITDETADEYLCEYCCNRGKHCDGKGNIDLASMGIEIKAFAIRPGETEQEFIKRCEED
jgi:hypothetical protein